MEPRKEKVNQSKKEEKVELAKTTDKITKPQIIDKEIVKEKKTEAVETPKKEIKEEKKEIKIVKTEAVINGKDLKISTKHSVAICNYIRNKNIDKAIEMLSEVLTYKKAIPMKGEIPHRKGKIMSGRYPIKALNEFIKLLKSLKANAIINELELEKYILFCKADVASRPYRRFGKGRFKRTNVIIKLILPVKKKTKRKK